MAAKKSPAKHSGSRTKRSPEPTAPAIPTLAVPDFDPKGFAGVCEKAEPDIRDLVKRLATVLQCFEEASGLGTGDALARGEKCANWPDSLEGIESLLSRCTNAMGLLKDQLTAWQSGEARSRRSRFEEIARALQWRLIGSWPEPVINGVVFVRMEEAKGRATVNGRPVNGLATAERIALTVDGELRLLEGNLTPAPEFAAQVWEAYRACHPAPGAGVGAFEVLGQLTWQRQSKGFQKDPRTELFRGYSLAQFRADLTNYLASGSPGYVEKGVRFDLRVVGGSFAQDGIYMYFPESDRLGTCGRLMFQEADRKSAQ